MDFDWKRVVGTVAPALGTALGGPLVGSAIKAIGDALGITEPTEEKIEAALKGATPTELLALRKADQEFTLQMKKLDINLETAYLADRDSARRREVEVKDKTNRNLAYLYTAGYFAVLAVIFLYEVPQASRDLLNILLGIMSGAQVAIMQYYFGSSKGSSDKNQLMMNKDK